MTLSLTRRRTPLASVSGHLVWISGTLDTDGEALGVQDRGDVLHRRQRGVVHRQDDTLHRALACPHRAPRRLSARQHRVGLVHDVIRPPPQPLALFLALGARGPLLFLYGLVDYGLVDYGLVDPHDQGGSQVAGERKMSPSSGKALGEVVMQ